MDKKDIRKITALRKELHQYPEISGHEKLTAKRIASFFSELCPEQIFENVGGNGVLVVFSGKDNGPVTMIRCELDALPIEEESQLRHKSKNRGIGHLCGHDGHMAILCGLGMELAGQRPARGKVILLFQPAEETGEGAAAILNSREFNAFPPDFAFSLHNIPGYEKNKILLKKGTFAAASKGMEILVDGSTSHAAYPEDGKSPTEAMCKIIIALEKLPEAIMDFTMVTVVNAELGEKAYGTSPGKAVVRATLRCYEDEVMEKLSGYCENLVNTISKEYQLGVRFRYSESFKATKNHSEAWNLVNKACKKLELNVGHIRIPFRWSEDFGNFSQQCRSMIFGIGAGLHHPQLHEPYYDFPDEIIPVGVQLFLETIHQINGQ